jgi:hypothetical protein
MTLAAQVVRRCKTMENLICTVHKLLLCPSEVIRTAEGVFIEYTLYDHSVVVVHKGKFAVKAPDAIYAQIERNRHWGYKRALA